MIMMRGKISQKGGCDNILKIVGIGASGMAQVAKHLVRKCEVLSSNPSITKKEKPQKSVGIKRFGDQGNPRLLQ
jgi:hypothetical protein